MASIDKNLQKDETIVKKMRPHWALLAPPILVLIALSVLFYFSHRGLVSALPHRSPIIDQILLYAYLLFLFVWALIPFLRWLTTKYLFTNQRIVTHTGILRTQERIIPLDRINELECSRSILERLYGSGSIVIEPAARNEIIIKHVRHAQEIQNQIYGYTRSQEGQARRPD